MECQLDWAKWGKKRMMGRLYYENINVYSYDISARTYWRGKYLAIYISDKPIGATQLDEARIIFFSFGLYIVPGMWLRLLSSIRVLRVQKLKFADFENQSSVFCQAKNPYYYCCCRTNSQLALHTQGTITCGFLATQTELY